MNEALHQEIAALRTRCAELEAQIAHIRDEGTTAQLMALKTRFGVSRQQAQVLFKLADGRPVSKFWLSENVSKKVDVDYNLASVLICKIRKQIKPLEIKTHWGDGYALEGDSLAAVRAVIGGAQ